MKQKKLSLLWKILIPTLIFVAFIISALSITSYILTENALERQINKEMNARVIALTYRISDWFDEILTDIKLMSYDNNISHLFQDDLIEKNALEKANKRFSELIKMYPMMHVLALANSDGELIVSSNRDIIGKINISDREYFKNSIKGKTFISSIIKSRANDDSVFIMSIPVSGKSGVKGVFFAAIQMEEFIKLFIDSVKIADTGYAYIINDKGICVAHPDRPTIGADISGTDFGRAMIQDKRGFISYNWKGISKFCAFNEFKLQNWIVVITAPKDEVFEDIGKLKISMIIIALAGLLLLCFCIAVLIKSIVVKPIDAIVSDLTIVTDKVNTAAQQIAMSGKTVSEGTSNQAASIEEASSSLEEMASMTQKNADNSNSAKKLAQQTLQSFMSANEAMTSLTSSMQEIAQSSSETQKIVKSIDEIAFQTNLLALNAAVEAARAGESGAGFAVVADEVRSLALRAAKASKNTSGLIEETVNKINAGNQLVEKANHAFNSASEDARKAGDLIDEISAASIEQSLGIKQINTAAAELDKVVQQNAAIAEESASGAEEMSNQAEELRNMIIKLRSFMGHR